jgi:hypothetical protein
LLSLVSYLNISSANEHVESGARGWLPNVGSSVPTPETITHQLNHVLSHALAASKQECTEEPKKEGKPLNDRTLSQLQRVHFHSLQFHAMCVRHRVTNPARSTSEAVSPNAAAGVAQAEHHLWEGRDPTSALAAATLASSQLACGVTVETNTVKSASTAPAVRSEERVPCADPSIKATFAPTATTTSKNGVANHARGFTYGQGTASSSPERSDNEKGVTPGTPLCEISVNASATKVLLPSQFSIG